MFESSDTTEDVRNYTVRQGFPVPTGRFAERGGIDDVPLFPDEDRTIFFAYLQDEWDFAPDWSLTTGVRIDEYSDFGTTVNPRVGLVWNTAYRLTTKLLYGRAFRPRRSPSAIRTVSFWDWAIRTWSPSRSICSSWRSTTGRPAGVPT